MPTPHGATAIWRVPAYLPYLQPPLTDAALAAAQDQLGVRLPEAFVQVLREQNGGYVRRSLADDDCPHSMVWGIGPHFPSILGYFEPLDPELAEDDEGAWVPAHSTRLVPFDGDGHWYLCLDYRAGGDTPSVTFVDVELENERTVAPSFDAFLARLTLDLGTHHLGITAPLSLDDVAERLAPHLGHPFEPAQSIDHGYPVRRCRLGTAADPEWVWASPNEVPRGFVRANHARRAALQRLLPGQALRFPEFAQASILLACSDEVREVLATACTRAGLPFIALHQPAG